MTSLPVLTAVADPRCEADLAARLHEGGGELTIARRCVDLPDLLAAAAAGLGRAAIVSPELRRFDRAALDRLVQARVAVVGFAAGPDAARRSEQLGIERVVDERTSVDDLYTTLLDAVGDLDRDPALERILDWSAAAALPTTPTSGDRVPIVEVPAVIGAGRMVAVWGPTGAPGRTSLAVNLAAELAGLGRQVVLVDADCYGGTVAQTVGLYDEAAGVATACRAVTAGRLDGDVLDDLLAEVRPGFRVLTGISRADRWPELRPGALRGVLAAARASADLVVIDTGFCLEEDEELSYDTAAPRRNGAALACLAVADVVVAVGSGDPVGLTRYARAHDELSTALPDTSPVTVINKVRPTVTGGGDPVAQVEAVLARHAGIAKVRTIPEDRAAYDDALALGRTLAEVAPRSPARQAIRSLAADLAGVPAPRRRWRRRTSFKTAAT